MTAVAHKRQFGVEIECGMPGGYTQAADLCGFRRDAYGYVEYERDDGWSIGNDGSGVELRTPILKGKRGFNALRKAMEKLKAGGGYVTRADGMHIHHDAPEFVDNPELCFQLVKSWRNNEIHIHSMVAPRRRSNLACPKWNEYEESSLESWAKDQLGNTHFYFGSRKDLNLTSLEEHGSIEIRLHEGTLDPDVAIAWIMFGQRLIHSVAKATKPLPRTQSDDALMRRIRLSPEARFALEQKKAQGFVTPGTNWRRSNLGR